MYSSSNQDFVRGTVTSFYEMFKQISIRKQSSNNDDTVTTAEWDEEQDFRAFAFGNDTLDDEKVCPMDDMEWQLKLRNEAMKRGCTSEQLEGVKQSFMSVRVVIDPIVQAIFTILQIIVCLFRMVISLNSESDMAKLRAELDFLFQKLVTIILEAMKQVADMLFNLIFSLGPLGQAMKEILMAICKMIQFMLAAWNETGMYGTNSSSTCFVL